MRKNLIVCVIASLVLFLSASPWEGSAAISPEGELPGNGRYIATNSFPKNTIVDIENIETNKSTRVIVAGNLDSPGLLAVVSKEAAELIGMRPGSISRIRMTQPSEPVAYARFTEGLSSGIIDYDSGDVITEDTYNEEFVNPARPSRSSRGYEDDYGVSSSKPSYAATPDAGYSAYVLEPEWTGTRSVSGVENERDIVDLPPDISAFGTKPVKPDPFLFDEPESITDRIPPESSGYSERIAEYFPEDSYEDVYYEDDFIEDAEEIAEADDYVDDYAYDYTDDYYNIPEDTPVETAEYNIVPTDERPPSNIYGIDPSLIIPGITNAVQPDTSNKAIDPVVPVNPVNEPRLSSGTELVRGKYYVQLASYDSPESAQNGFNRLDQQNDLNFSKYEPQVYKDGDKRYQIILGPLNQGESAAVLARFKSFGYKDAFVRVVR